MVGARFVLMRSVERLVPGVEAHGLELTGGGAVHARAVLLAGGAQYRRLGVPELDELIGAGVFYGAAVSEASAMHGMDVFVAGSGNSTGEAVVHLARHAKKVTLLVRGGQVSASMSDYPVQELAHTANVDVYLNAEVVGGGGSGRLEWLRLRDRRGGETRDVAAAALFVLIGAVPHTDWLTRTAARDSQGYVQAVGEGATAVASIHQFLQPRGR
jgi:thioredoxin reductase (NADPH)